MQTAQDALEQALCWQHSADRITDPVIRAKYQERADGWLEKAARLENDE